MQRKLMLSLNMRLITLGLALLLPCLGSAAVTATGGAETTIPGYTVHAFKTTGSNSFSVAEDGYVEVLVVGGGGGGGFVIGGGGGAGGFVESSRFLVAAGSNYIVTVGAGGVGSPTNEGYGPTTIGGRRGEDSSFAELVAYGGGGGRNYQSDPPSPYLAVGSGGGMGASSSLGPCLGTDGQGHAGGLGRATNYGGGGGGAGADGESKNAAPGSAGGAGLASAITGTATYYAGGGGGGTRTSTRGLGGLGGLGGGGAGSNYLGHAGMANTGGGGGGAGYQSGAQAGGNGGSGIVIIRYRSTDSLLVMGSPENYGTPTPAYGITNGLEVGDAFICSVPTGWVPVASGTRADCSGYQLFTNDVLAVADTTNAFTYTHATYGTLIWQWQRQHEITFSAGAGGTVSTSGGWYDEDSTVTVTASVTDSRRQFSYWAGDVPAGMENNATLTFTADRPRNISAYFGGTYHVSTNGSDAADGLSWATAKLTIQSALTDARDGDAVLVSNGTYSITAQLSITNGIELSSVNGPTNTIITRAVTDRCRILYVDHADAFIHGFTIANGFPAGQNTWGGGIYIDTTGGTVSNCIITGNKVELYSYGAGVYLNKNGHLKNCRIVENTNGSKPRPGGGVYMNEGGILENCVIANNKVEDAGAGVYMNNGGLLKNCLVYGNYNGDENTYGADNGAAGVHIDKGGTVVNCTIANNQGHSVGGLVCDGGGSVVNSIIYFNKTSAGAVPNVQNIGTGWSYSNSCTTPTVAGNNNTTLLPQFTDVASRDYRLLPGSPCIGSGINETWMETAGDLDGNQRRYGTFVDMGAYEYITGALDCSPNGTPTIGLEGTEIVFTADVSGTNTANLYYKWDFDADGTFEIEGADKAVVTNIYSTGLHDLRLVVENGLGEVSDRTRRNYIKVGPAIAYVSTNSTPVYPYTNWNTAAASIQDAIDVGVDGTIVLVSNGVYGITKQIVLEEGVSLRSINGPANTIITRTGTGDSRICYLSHTNAVVDGFTVSNGLLAITWTNKGGGVLINYGGKMINCHIVNNRVDRNSYGCGATLNQGGILENCYITHNWNSGSTYSGGGVYCYMGGTVLNSVIAYNSLSGKAAKGAGIYLDGGGLIRNSLVFCNTNSLNTSLTAGGVHCASGGTVENCTIVENYSQMAGGLVCEGGGTVLNSIVYLNESNDTATDNTVTSGTGWSFAHCCTTAAVAGTGNIDDDPLFINPPSNYRLKLTSPCFNAGLKQPWMDTATDLDGLPRLQARKVDIGAYEIILPTGTRLIVR